MRTKGELKALQSLSLSAKINMTLQRIDWWIAEYGEDGVYIAFSGGKDSTVLLDLARKYYPYIPAVYVNTGLEYPEIQAFVKRFENVEIIRPKMRFDEVIKKYGYPIISKEVSGCVIYARNALAKGNDNNYRLRRLRGEIKGADGKPSMFNHQKYEPLLYTDFLAGNKCCDIMKKNPSREYEKRTCRKGITAVMAIESKLRTQKWLQNGCNGFHLKRPTSNPMSFWTEQDVLQYIKTYSLPIAEVYGEIVCVDKRGGLRAETFCDGGMLATTGCQRTGCIFCGFGTHLEKGVSRFERLRKTHPRQYEYCIGGGEYDTDGLWKPNKNGLGMGYVFDSLNQIYGKNFIRY